MAADPDYQAWCEPSPLPAASSAGSRQSGTASGAASSRGDGNARCPRPRRPVTIRPQDAARHAGQVVGRVLLRRNIVTDAETAQLVAAAVQAALQAGTPSPAAASKPACSPADCERLF